MPEYIERETVLNKLNDIAKNYLEDNSIQCSLAAGVVCSIKEEVFEIPTADVVEVVRCKDCYFSCKDDSYENGYICHKPLYHPQKGERRQRKLMQDIDFCSFGKRKEGENDA